MMPGSGELAESDWRALGCEGTGVELTGNSAQRLRTKTDGAASARDRAFGG